MSKMRCLLFFALLQCCCFCARAQSNMIPFEHIGPAQGLSESNIFCITQDKKGFMWFGSWDGLNKYDGYKITVYKNIPGDSVSLSNNYINDLAEDNMGNLWVATDNGLNYFDRTKETFRRFKHNPNDASSVRNNVIGAVIVDRQGTVWIGTENGVDTYDPKKNTFGHPDVLGNSNAVIPGSGVKNIYEDSRGNIWFCNIDNGLSVYNPVNKTFRYFRQTENPASLAGNNVNAVFEDSKHRIWIGTNGRGLDLYDEQTNSFKHFKHDDNNPQSIPKNVVLAINEDDNNNLWVSTENGGISVLNYDAGIYDSYQHDEINQESISNNSIYTIYKDSKGNMWLGNFAGWVDMAMRDKLLFPHYKHTMNANSLGHKQVMSIMEDRQKKIWIGTDGGGLDIFDPTTGKFEHYRHQKDNPASICGDNVLSTLEDSKGNTWIGTWIDGISVMNGQRKVIRHFKHDNNDSASLCNNNVWKIFEDSDKVLWFATNGGGLDMLNPDGKSFTHYRHNDADSRSIACNDILNIFEDKEGILWICCSDKGIDRFDKETQTFTHLRHSETGNSISDNNTNSLFEDANGNYWIGTMNGLNFYDKKTNHFTVYTKANGLAGDYVFGILEDDKKNLWLSTNSGISKFNPVTKVFENYTVTDGVQSNEFKQLAVCKASNGMMYLGGINGFNQFYPDLISRKSFEPPLVITGFTVLNKEVPIQTDNNNPSPLKQAISETKSITLPYSASVFSFEFASLNYTSDERKLYFYKLEGFDKTWIEAGTARTATYTHLPPGTYTFKVKGLNNDGKPSANIASIELVILPPFWLTWWFELGCFLAVSGLLLAFYRYRVRAIKLQRNNLEKKVNEQTYELQLSAAQERKAREEAEAANTATMIVNAELAESEQRYSNLFYESPQPMWVYDIETLKITQVNKAAVLQYGYSESEFLSMTISNLTAPDDKQNATKEIFHTIQSSGTVFSGRSQLLKKSKEIIEADLHSSIIVVNNKEYILLIAVDITAKILLDKKVNRAIIKTQEDERYEIGSELHDNVCQVLVSSQMNIAMLNNSLPPSMKLYYENSKTYLKQALDEIRDLSHRLAPAFFDDISLEDAFNTLITSVNVSNQLHTSVLFYKSVKDKQLSRDLQLNLYRILQEQLKNIIQHAKATELSVDVLVNDQNELQMLTADNGVGFEELTTKHGIGFSNIKRRAELFSGQFIIDSSPGKGCVITITIPLKEALVS